MRSRPPRPTTDGNDPRSVAASRETAGASAHRVRDEPIPVIFAPHGWTGIGAAASLLMFSFIGWEAGSHLVGEFRDPARQLPRALLAALAIVVVLYLGLAVTTVGVLGTAAPSNVPLADLMAAGLGAPGRAATAVLAVLLTICLLYTSPSPRDRS